MTKAVPASPTLAYLIPGGAFASGQGYYVDRSPRGLLRQLAHRGALCRTGVSWLQPPHPTPIPKRRLGRRGALVDKQCCLAGRLSAKLRGRRLPPRLNDWSDDRQPTAGDRGRRLQGRAPAG